MTKAKNVKVIRTTNNGSRNTSTVTDKYYINNKYVGSVKTVISKN